MTRSAAVLALAGALSVCGCAAEPDPSAPNVVMITIDTLRPDHLDLYGYDTETAPFLRSLGEAGVVFDNAFSTSSWTAPSTASMFTGSTRRATGHDGHPPRHRRLQEKVAAEGAATLVLNRLPGGAPRLPQLMRERGYATYGVATNINIGEEMGFDDGFDEFKRKNMASVEYVRDRLETWSDDILSDPPFFLYLHLNDVHAPYEGEAPWYVARDDEREDTVAAYDSEIRYVDGVLREIVDRFDPEREGLVVVLSDHGEEFWERGELGHLFSLHGEVSRIPLIVYGPALGVKVRRIDDNVSLVDVLPTLLDLVGAAVPEGLDGVSLASAIRSDAAPALPERALFGHRVDEYGSGRELWSAVRGDWKLIEEDGRRRLYDLSTDPEELRDVASQQAEVAADLAVGVRALREAAPTDAPNTVELEIDDERLRALESLGYVEEASP